MTVLVQNLVPGLTREQYEGIAAALRDKLKATPDSTPITPMRATAE